ncbi:MAG: hydroxyacid dehydrogenase [Omnitrophica bacterium RIFCSPLOWO2_12_FULL_50_11]|nr:MAG: hydroxyacid dehydrogenase [Omnitrophica bacterium RIFCSPLOWO2_12_FULL_50_11]
MTKENKSALVLYQTEDGKTRLEVRLQDETAWLTQKMMADLFQVAVPTINEHVKNIYAEGELISGATIRKFLIVQKEGSREISRSVDFYNLEMIVAVGFRVRSHRGTQFRKWAIDRINEYMVKGFAMDDERLKAGVNIGSDYFDDMLDRIRDIRSSEKRFYQKIRDIYKLAVDYDPKAEETLEFFRIVQNKLHFAISGKTAAELIYERADAKKANMGLTSWKGVKVRRDDVAIAKNYLNKKEMEGLNRIVTMYLDYAEDQAKRHLQIFMRDWRKKLDAFLKFNEREILNNPGKVRKEVADQLALDQYEIYHRHRLALEAKQEAFEDDRELKRIQNKIEKKKKQK